MKPILFLLILIFSFIMASDAAEQKTFGLSKNELKSLENEPLVKKITIKNELWPEVIVFQRIKATPLESIAIFLALDYQSHYLPKVIKSIPVKHLSSTEVLTEYEMELPWPLSNVRYIHGSVLKKVSNGFKATWYMVKSTSTDKVSGQVEFTSYQGQTLMRYSSIVKPKSIFGGMVKDLMVKDVVLSMKAIKRETEKLRIKNSDTLKKYQRYILDSLKGINVYEKVINNHRNRTD